MFGKVAPLRVPRTLLFAAAILPVGVACTQTGTADANAPDEAVLDATVDAHEPVTCVISFEMDGALVVEYLDGGVIGPYMVLPDGAGVFDYADGAKAGSAQTGVDGRLDMGGPCDRFA